MSTNVNRRKLIKQVLTGSAAIATGAVLPSNILAAVKNQDATQPLKGNIQHSACRWCYDSIPTATLAKNFKQLGMVGMDLVGPSEWKILKENNLISTMCNGAEISLTEGFNTLQYHDKLVKNYIEHINYVADAGYTNLICFSGNRRGMDDETGLNNSVTGLKKIMAHAEKRGVMIQMELLNSRVDHKDYMCDRSSWGVELCKRLGSPNFKLLFDIYHMQIDEGDIIHSIRTNHQY
jgi:hydroxypyruvate isomerase